MSYRSAVRNVLPSPVLTGWRAARRGLSVTTARVTWLLDPRRFRNARKLLGYRDRHLGQRCFILGNGPSLRGMDLKPLKTEITFGLNRIYLLRPSMGFDTTYYVAVNQLVISQFWEEIRALNNPKFLSWYSRDLVGERPDVAFLRDPHDGTCRFGLRPSHYVWEGATVTFVALQLAYYMGFQQVILVGVDHRFSTPGAPHSTITSTTADANHFDPDYFGPGIRWQLPDLETSQRAYLMAREAFAAAGRNVVDATENGALTVFQKVSYAGLVRR